MTRPRVGVLRRFDVQHLGLVLLVALPVLSAFREKIADTDLWWHLKAGEWIATERAVPWTDPFSYTAADRPWIAYSWLAELLMHETVSHLGFGALLWVKGLLGAVLLAFVWAACRAAPSRALVALLSTALAALGTSGGWGERPQLVTLVFLAVLVWCLRDDRCRSRLHWIAPPLVAVWANVHILFVAGLALLGVEAAAATIARRPSRQLWVACFASALATLATPYGIHLWLHLPTIARQPSLVPAIVEFQGPDFTSAYGVFILVYLLASLAILALSREPLSLAELVEFLGSLAMGFYMVRNMPLFAVLSAPIVARRLDRLWPATDDAESPDRMRLTVHYALAAAVLGLVISFAPRARGWRDLVVSEEFPVGAADFVAQRYAGGKLFNTFEWGGFLIHRLHPRFRVSIDGRTQLYGERIFARYTDTHYLRGEWWRFLEEAKPDLVIWPSHGPLALKLREARGWRVVFDDGVAAVFTRAGVYETIRSYSPGYAPEKYTS